MLNTTSADVLESMLSDISDVYDKNEGYLLYDLLHAAAIEIAKSNTELVSVQNLLNVDNLTGDLLVNFVKQRKGIERTPATYASGVVTVTGNGTVRVGDLFETKSGIQYKATEEQEISTTGKVKVSCVASGLIGNVPAQQVTQIPVTLSGITGVTNEQPITGGYEIEREESLRERYYVAVRTPATSGNVYHYLQWAKEVSGVGDVKVFPAERGNNTVEVVIIDQEKKPADNSLVGTVQNYIDPNSEGLGNGQAPIGAHCYVVAATEKQLSISANVALDGSLEQEATKSNIEEAIKEYLKTIAFKSDYVSYAKIGETILNAAGVEDYSNLTINDGIENVSVGAKEVATLGGVTLV